MVVILIFDENDNLLEFNFLYYNILILEDIFVGKELFRI